MDVGLGGRAVSDGWGARILMSRWSSEGNVLEVVYGCVRYDECLSRLIELPGCPTLTI